MAISRCVSILIILTVKDCWSLNIQELECSFTEGLCGWSNGMNNEWKLGDYGDKSFGKPFRNTFGDGYIYTSARKSELISPEIEEDDGPFCLAIAYYMFGYGSPRLTIFLADANRLDDERVMVNNEIWRSDHYKRDDWLKGYYYVGASQRTKTRIIISLEQSNVSNFSLGPITVKRGPCDYIESCNFENPASCSWTINPDNSSDYTWFISNGLNSSELAAHDTTTDSPKGQYLRTTDNGPVDSTSTWMTSFSVGHNKVKCLNLNLMKRNSDSDQLTISLLKDDDIESQTIWTSEVVPSQSNWQPIEVNIHETGQFDILITAHKRWDGLETGIAIDDLRMNPNPCNTKIDCSFEHLNCKMDVASGPMLIGYGRLSNGQALNYSMSVTRNNDPNNSFIYTDIPIESNRVNYQLRNQLIHSINDSCLSFYYFMELIDPLTDPDYTFKVNIQSVVGSIQFTYDPLIILGQWTKDQVQTPRSDDIYIEFVLDTESKLFAGFDNIKLFEGQCSSLN